MIIQLHWQNHFNLDETIFVAQGDHHDVEEALLWVKDVIDQHREEIPKDWIPLVCTKESQYFKPQDKADEPLVIPGQEPHHGDLPETPEVRSVEDVSGN